jgi:MoxR-like ATPase
MEPNQEMPIENEGVDVSFVQNLAEKINAEIAKVVIGNHEIVDYMVAAMLTGGHILLEGPPGVAKTLMAKLLAQSVQTDFSRIQFTPDLMPSDVTGTSVFNLKTSEFSFMKGPIFSNIVLIDEINRAPAKTQSSLFEVMEELQVSVDGNTYPMGFPYMVMATQNPIEQEGTYRLPEAQLDRFVFKLKIDYPDLNGEKEILRRFQNDFKQNVKNEVQAVCNASDIRNCQELIETVFIQPDLLDYIAAIVDGTRNHRFLFLGASPRASLAILKTSKALAALNGRNFVTPDDVRSVTYPVLNHRVALTPEKEMEGITIDEVITEIIQKIEVPR